MTPNDDGNLEQPTGGAEAPLSQPSSGQGQQLSSVDALLKRLDEQDKVIKGLQKGIDKRFERQDSNIKRILELKEQGLDERGIERELFLDSLIAGQKQDAPPPPSVGNESGRQAPDVESAFQTLERYNLSQNDPEFLNLLRGSTKMDKVAFEAKVKDYVLAKVAPQKPASVADVVQSPATTRTTEKKPEELISDYKKEMLAAPRGPKGDEARRAIKNKYIQQGANIYGVDFTS